MQLTKVAYARGDLAPSSSYCPSFPIARMALTTTRVYYYIDTKSYASAGHIMNIVIVTPYHPRIHPCLIFLLK
jgi:hypothetical protein